MKTAKLFDNNIIVMSVNYIIDTKLGLLKEFTKTVEHDDSFPTKVTFSKTGDTNLLFACSVISLLMCQK